MSERRPQVRGSEAETKAIARYGLVQESTSWYDAVDPDNGAKYEVKSGKDKVRLWEDQHQSLTSANARGTAYYVFVHVDRTGTVVKMQRRRPQTVTKMIRDAGGWVKSGHERTEKREKQLPIDTVI